MGMRARRRAWSPVERPDLELLLTMRPRESRIIGTVSGDEGSVSPSASASKSSDVAIVGMSAIMPGAGDVRTFWENTLQGVDAITEVPGDRWDWRLYYDVDPKAPDKIVSKWGGFVPDVPFDPLRYGMPPSSLPSIEPVQLLLLEATTAAIADAGYADRPFCRERTAVILGMGGGAAQLAMGYAFRSYLPMLDTVRPGAGSEALEACEGLLPEWTEDSFPGFLLNVAAGRLANRFDFGGANYTVDAACGSSLAAASLAVRELETGSADVVILGGADTVQNPFTYLAFSKTRAFSPRGRCRPFDASADGIVISEGVAIVVLKRLADAERDGDRIYAVIKGMGASSDGRAKGLTAPSPDGQVRAVERAYTKAEIDPTTVGYVEAHGTGTAVGDVVEVNAISKVFRAAGAVSGSVAIGSVKSMIGHTKCAAGLAGLINASLSLHHKLKPPTIGLERPNPGADLLDGPFRVNTRALPWVHSVPDHPRRAGVSAFGFGGTNFHAVLEAYEGDQAPTAPARDWPAELFAWRSADRDSLLIELESLVRSLEAGSRPVLRDLARAVNAANPPRAGLAATLAIIATSHDDLFEKLRSARAELLAGTDRIDNPLGLFYEETPRFLGQPIAFLFPGQGSQSTGMLADLTMAFPEVLGAFDDFDAALTADGRPGVGPIVFPGSGQADEEVLRSTDAAQPAIGAASVGLLRLLAGLEIEPDVVAGHSFGELVALHSAGSLSVGALATLAHERGRLMLEALGDEAGSMAAFAAGVDEVVRVTEGLGGVLVVNENGPRQAVVAGPSEAMDRAIERAKLAGIRAQVLPVAGAFHTSKLGATSGPLALAAGLRITSSPDRPVYSNLDAKPHPSNASEIASRLGEHLARPVRFASMIEAMHRDGARVFVEVGPGSILSPLVESILGDRPHLAVSCDSSRKPGIATLLLALGRLLAAGVPVRLDRLSLGRSTRALDLANLPVGDGSPGHSATTWLVNGSRARPIGQPEPNRLGQGPALPLPVPEKPSGRVARGPAPPAYHNGSTNGHHSNGHPTNGKAMTPTSPPFTPDPSSIPTLGQADAQVLASFQETMRSFLDVQRSTMLAYLAGRQGAAAAVAASVMTPKPAPPAGRISPQAFELGRPETQSAPPPSVPKLVEAAQAAPPTVREVDREAVASKLVEIVRDRTGYPSEMLGLDLDLEADLGIDSIKRVEILGTLRDAVPTLGESSDPSTMDALSRAKTLGAIVETVVEVVRKLETGKPGTEPTEDGDGRHTSPRAGQAERADSGRVSRAVPEVEVHPTRSSPVRRMVLEVVPAPLSPDRSGLVKGGVVVVTDDGRGVARGVAAKLEAAGHSVVLAGREEIDFSSPSSVEGLLDLARSSGEVAGIVHVLPLRECPPAGLDREAWTGRIGPEVKGLFLLAKAAAEDLERSSIRGGGALVAATSMGGTFATGADGLDFFPGHGGVAGLVKTLAREWPGVRARVVDFDPRAAGRRHRLEAGGGGPRRRRLGRGRLLRRPTDSNPRRDFAAGSRRLVEAGARERRAGDRHRGSPGDHRDGRRRVGQAMAADPLAARAEPPAP